MLRNLNQSFSRGRICGTPHSGVRGSSIPSDGEDGAAYAYNDLSLPEDAEKEICGRITKWPAAGKLFVYEDTSFTFTDAPDGLHTAQYQLSVDGVDVGSQVTIALVVGDSAVVATAAWTEADDVIAIGAEVTAEQIAAAISWTEENDTVSIQANAALGVTGAAAWVEDSDIVAISAISQIVFARAPSGSGYSPKRNEGQKRPANTQRNYR